MAKRYDKAAMRAAMFRRWESVGRRCENCGATIPEPTYTNFAHRKGRNLSTAEEIENGFFVVCEVLHIYQHTLAINLEQLACVRKFVDNWHGRKLRDRSAKFWPDRLEYSP